MAVKPISKYLPWMRSFAKPWPIPALTKMTSLTWTLRQRKFPPRVLKKKKNLQISMKVKTLSTIESSQIRFVSNTLKTMKSKFNPLVRTTYYSTESSTTVFLSSYLLHVYNFSSVMAKPNKSSIKKFAKV